MDFNNDYNEIYLTYATSGFRFNYNKRLSKSKVILRDEIVNIPLIKRNDDDVPLFVFCKPCDVYMDYIDGNWCCPSCKRRVRELTIYRQLERENEEYINSIQIDIPECCEACGGPYPDCLSSCKLFDD